MNTSRDDVSIAIRSAFLTKGTKQRFSLFVLIVVSIILIFVETIETKPLNYIRSLIKDTIYRSALIISYPSKGIGNLSQFTSKHINLYENYTNLKSENAALKEKVSNIDFLELENNQLKKLIDEDLETKNNLVSARVIIDKQSPYLNSFIVNVGSNKNIKNGMEVLNEKNFIGRIVDVNFFSSRVLLVSDLNSKIPVLIEPSGNHAILSGHGKKNPSLQYLPKNHSVKDGDKVYTSGKEGIFSPGIPIGEVKRENETHEVLLFSNLDQISFVNINLGEE